MVYLVFKCSLNSSLLGNTIIVVLFVQWVYIFIWPFFSTWLVIRVCFSIIYSILIYLISTTKKCRNIKFKMILGFVSTTTTSSSSSFLLSAELSLAHSHATFFVCDWFHPAVRKTQDQIGMNVVAMSHTTLNGTTIIMLLWFSFLDIIF